MGFVVAEGSAERQFEPGHQPPAAPSPAPPRREARNELKPPTAFRITADRTQRRRPRPGAVGDLDPNDAGSGSDRDRDRLPRSTRAGVPDRITEDLANQRDRVIPHGCPGSSTSKTNERGARARPPASRSPGPPPRSSPTRPSPPAPPPETSRAASGRRDMHAQLCRERQAAHRAAQHLRRPGPWLVRGCGPRPWPSVQSRRSLMPLSGPDSRPPCVRGHRNTAPYSATR